MIEIKPIDESILVFIHVKKTAGISVQRILSHQFRNKFYGGHTHGELRDYVRHNELSKSDILDVQNGSCICKHWSMSDYAIIENRCNFVTIFRHPLDRILSHYNFYRRHHPSGISINEYIKHNDNINLFSRMINPLKLCEFYMFDTIDTDLSLSSLIRGGPMKHLNKTPYDFHFSDRQKENFLNLNSDDLELYKWAQSNRRIL